MADNYVFIGPAELTAQQVAQVRSWRVDQDMSWRAVAEAAAEVWGWGYGGNQIFGEELCEAAAHALGQDPWSEPWN